MDILHVLVHPFALEEGREYLRQEPAASSVGRTARPVKLIAYDPCPAFVIVEDGGSRKRCPRDQLFALGNGHIQQTLEGQQRHEHTEDYFRLQI